MENQEKGLTVNIGEYKGEKPIEVVYRIGNAPKALDELPIGKSSVSCPLKPSDSAPLKHSTMPP